MKEQKYEYGIEWTKPEHRDVSPHRTGLTLGEAVNWFGPGDGDIDWDGLFKIIRRPIGDWEDFE